MAPVDESSLPRPFSWPRHWWEVVEDERGNAPSRSLYVGNIPLGIKGSAIRYIFAEFGEIQSSSPPAFGRADRGYAFLNYTDVESAQRALFHCHLRDLFGNGECNIRFTGSQQQPKMQGPARGSKISEARSEWFQQTTTTTTAPQAAGIQHIGTADGGPQPQNSKLPPAAPKKMREFAEKVAKSPSAPRTVRVDVSPPPIRRVDLHRPERASTNDGHRSHSYFDRRSSQEFNYKGLDRYVPSHRAKGEPSSPLQDTETHLPHHRGRSPRRSPSYSPYRGKNRAPSSSPVGGRASPLQAKNHDRPVTGARSTTARVTCMETGEIQSRPGKDTDATASVSLTAEASSATASLGHLAAAAHEQTEESSTNASVHNLKDLETHLQQLDVEAFPDDLNDVVTAPVTGTRPTIAFSLPSTDKTREVQAVQTSTSGSAHRMLLVPADDNSSVTSSSTKSSQRKKQCSYCKSPDSVLMGTLTKCSTCSRRYHASCGTPSPDSAKEPDSFTCGRCLRKSRMTSSMSEQTRAMSPELGTPNNDSLLNEAASDESAKDLEDLTTAPGFPAIETQTLAVDEAVSDIAIGGVRSGQSLPQRADAHLIAPLAAFKQTGLTSPLCPAVDLVQKNETTHRPGHGSLSDFKDNSVKVYTNPASSLHTEIPQVASPRSPSVKNVTREAGSDDSFRAGEVPRRPLSASPKAFKSRLTNFDGPADQHIHPESFDKPERFETARPQKDQCQTTYAPSGGSSGMPMAPTLTRVQAAAAQVMRSYKSVTCLEWKFSRCTFSPNTCNFAHHETGTGLPGFGFDRDDEQWTCYRWMNGRNCLYPDRCPFAHTDTGLYVGIDGKYSKKHITCAFWQTGRCKHTEQKCLFAHQDTGISAGRKAVEGAARRAGVPHHRRQTSGSITNGILANDPRNGSSITPSSPPRLKLVAHAGSGSNDQSRVSNINSRGSCDFNDVQISREERNEKQLPSSGTTKPTSSFSAPTSNTNIVESSPYSPRSTVDRDSKVIHGVNTPFSPTSSIAKRDQDLIHGVDTPFSPTSTVITAIQNTPHRITGDVNARSRDTALSPHAPSSRDPTFSPVPALSFSSVSGTPVPQKSVLAQGKESPGLATATTDRPRSSHGKPSSLESSNTSLLARDGPTIASDSSRDAMAKLADSKSVPSKHFAKRSTVDPRMLRRNLVASGSAKSTSPAPPTVPNITNIKKCEKCSKKILGSALLCTGCIKQSDMTRSPAHETPEQGEAGASNGSQKPLLPMAGSDNIHSAVLEFMEANAAKSVLAVAKKHVTSSMNGVMRAKSLKRPYEDVLFIQRKRPKVIIPLRKPSTDDSGGAKSSESRSAEEGIRLEREKNDMQANAEAPRHERCSLESPGEPGGNKENRRPSFSSISTEDQEWSLGKKGPNSEVPETIDKTTANSPPQTEDHTTADSQPLTRPTTEADKPQVPEKPPQAAASVKKRRSILKLQIKRPRCSNCAMSHKKCLHDSSGKLDPARCAEYLEERKNFPKGQGSFDDMHLARIKGAAKLYRSARGAETSSEEDNYTNDGDAEHQSSEEPVAPASPSSSEDPLGNIVTHSDHRPKPRPGRLDGTNSSASSADKAKEKSPAVQAPILTPAQTPTPASQGPAVAPSQQTPSKAPLQPEPAPKPDHRKLLAMLKKRGVQFESDTDEDSDEEMEDANPSATAQPTFSWPPKESSLNLFDVAPALRPPVKPATTVQKPSTSSPKLRAGLCKKDLWKNLSQIQCAERRAKFGNPHKIVERDVAPRMVKTTVQQDAPMTEQQRLKFHVPDLVKKEIVMPFERFLRMPEEPVVVRERTRREGGKVEFDLAFRDGKRERERAVTLAGRKVRESGERWPFARG